MTCHCEVMANTIMNEVAPHKCPACGEPCYMGLTVVQCTNDKCRNFDEVTHAYFVGSQRNLITAAEANAKAVDKVPRHPSHYVTAFEAALPGCYVQQVSMTQDRYNHGVHLDIKVFVPDLVWRVKPTPTPSATPYPLTQTGTKLDAWAKRCGFPDRAPGETDDELRQRVIAGLKGQP